MRPALRCCLLVALCSLVGAGLAGVAVADAAVGGSGVPADEPAVDDPSTIDLRTASSPAGDAAGRAGTAASATTAASTTASATAAGTATASDRTIELRQELRHTPDREGEYDARHRYRIPAEVTELEVTLPADATVTSQSGFARKSGTTYAWDGATRRPTLTYRVPADETVEGDGPIAGPGEYLFADRREWALVSRPRAGHGWRWTGGGRVGIERATVVDGEGATGDAIAFLGPHEEYRHEAHGQTFRLIVPAAADLEADREELFASLAHASDAMRVGNRDGEVFLVAAPTGEVQWGVRGLQTGAADVWVRDVERLDDPNNVWLHEYVHTRQDYEAAASARWFTEGAAVYYAALLTLQQDRIEFDAFRKRLARGTSAEFDGVRLAEPGTWRRNPDYHVGALVAGELDRQIRLATDSERSLGNVFRRMNERDEAIDADGFESYLRADGGSDVERLGDRYARTTERPGVWTAREHGEAFGTDPARMSYALPGTDDPDAYRVAGPYRERAVGDARPIVLVPGETLALDATVANVGGTTGDYEATFRIDGEPADRRTGRLAPGESATLTFEREFAETGRYALAVGDATVTVDVREPARGRVTDFAVDRTRVSSGATVRLSITVANDADYPGELAVPITENGAVAARETVRLDAREERTVTVERTLDEPGAYAFGLGDAAGERVTVTVTPAAPSPEQPGFGAATGAAAVIGAALVARRLGG